MATLRTSHILRSSHRSMTGSRKLIILAAFLPAFVSAQEVGELCHNGIDDDSDGQTDLNDTGCPCTTSILSPGTVSYIRNHSFEDRLTNALGQVCCPLTFVYPTSPAWLSCPTGWGQATSATSDYFHECGYSPAGMPLPRLSDPAADDSACVGFYAFDHYYEYVGSNLMDPLPANPLLGGTSYTLSLWVAAVGANDAHSQTEQQAVPDAFNDPFPLAIFGHVGTPVFPIGTFDCIGLDPAWMELGRVLFQPTDAWTHVSITLTPTVDIQSIMIGGACDIPSSFTNVPVEDDEGNRTSVAPYFLVDELMLTEAGDQVLLPVGVSGTLCMENAAVTGTLPPGAVGRQWHKDGVAIPGQTGATFDVSGSGQGSGFYVMTTQYNGECLMGSTFVPPPIYPEPWLSLVPAVGCAPLEVAYADTSLAGTTTLQLTFGDGESTTVSEGVHTYDDPGTYDLYLRIRNLMGCESDSLFEDAVVVHPPVFGQMQTTPNPTDTENTTIQFTSTGSSGPIVSWWWDLPGADPAEAVTPDVMATFPAVAGTYPVTLVVEGAPGCTDTIRSAVVITETGDIRMPNIFSPNGDDQNERFVPLDYSGAPGLLEIFNRWGQLIFSTRSLAQGWTGSGAPDGTYFFLVTPDDTHAEKLTGHVTLVR